MGCSGFRWIKHVFKHKVYFASSRSEIMSETLNDLDVTKKTSKTQNDRRNQSHKERSARSPRPTIYSRKALQRKTMFTLSSREQEEGYQIRHRGSVERIGTPPSRRPRPKLLGPPKPRERRVRPGRSLIGCASALNTNILCTLYTPYRLTCNIETMYKKMKRIKHRYYKRKRTHFPRSRTCRPPRPRARRRKKER